MQYSHLSDAERLARTQILTDRKIKVILDTDTFNEVDDQFVVAYTLLSSDRLDVQAIYAAQYVNAPEALPHYKSQTAADSANLFRNASARTPEEGERKSYEEICTLMSLMGLDPTGVAFHGCDRPLPDEETYVDSPAVDDLIRRAMQSTPEDPLYVVTIGACTNLSSAIIKCPAICDRIVAVPLLGNAYSWPDNNEFNFYQDPAATRVLFNSGCPLIQVPAKGMSGYLRISVPELDAFMGAKSPLTKRLMARVAEYTNDRFAWSKPIWDIATMAILVNPAWASLRIASSPVFATLGSYAFDERRHLIRCVIGLERDNIFRDLFTKLKMMDPAN